MQGIARHVHEQVAVDLNARERIVQVDTAGRIVPGAEVTDVIVADDRAVPVPMASGVDRAAVVERVTADDVTAIRQGAGGGA